MIKSHEIASAEGHSGRTVIARILPDTELYAGIVEICKKHKMLQGYISCCIGSLKQVNYVVPIISNHKSGIEYCNPIALSGPVHFISGQGVVYCSEDGDCSVHMHAAFNTSGGEYGAVTRSGHLLECGNQVLVTIEIVIAEITGVKLSRRFDEGKGMPALYPEQEP